MYAELSLNEYKTAWLEAERCFAINCFSVPECLLIPQNNNIQDIPPLDKLKEQIDTRHPKDVDLI